MFYIITVALAHMFSQDITTLEKCVISLRANRIDLRNCGTLSRLFLAEDLFFFDAFLDFFMRFCAFFTRFRNICKCVFVVR